MILQEALDDLASSARPAAIQRPANHGDIYWKPKDARVVNAVTLAEPLQFSRLENQFSRKTHNKDRKRCLLRPGSLYM
jgi:hypothetical protein